MDQWKQRLIGEFRADPKKGVALMVISLVAIGFWAPKMIGWFNKSNATASAAALHDETPAIETISEKEGGVTGDASMPFETVAEWIDEDPLMLSATNAPTSRDPFFPPRSEIDEAARLAALASQAKKAEAPSPESIGMTLTSTIVGPQRRVALIGGQAYAEGRRIIWPAAGSTVTYRLAEVHADRVVLQSAGHRYTLKVPTRGPENLLVVEPESQLN